MDITKIIKNAQISAGHFASGARPDIDESLMPYLLEEIWKQCAIKGMLVNDFEYEVLQVLGYRKYVVFTDIIFGFIIEKIHSRNCFVYDRGMYIDDEEQYKD